MLNIGLIRGYLSIIHATSKEGLSMKKLITTVIMVLLMTSGFFAYKYMTSDEIRLRQLGYSNQEILQLLQEDSNLVQKLISKEQKSDYIMDFLNIPMFTWFLYDEYVTFSQEHSTLEIEEVVATVSFLNHVFIPTLIQSGYEEEIIETWQQSDQFQSYIAQANLVALNNLLGFAQLTGSELNVLYKYVDYENRSPHLEIEEVINYVDFYKMTVIPELKLRGFSEEEINEIYQSFQITNFTYLLETNLDAKQTLELIKTDGFNVEKLSLYEEILNKNLRLGATYAVNVVNHPNVKGNFYEQIVETPNQNGLLVLVNRNFRLNYRYRPNEFAKVNVPVSSSALSNSNFLRKEAALATEEMFAQASKVGHHLILGRGFVSFETQQHLFSQNASELIDDLGITEVPRAGHSEHQTGLAVAITTAENGEALTQDFAKTTAGQWVSANAHHFGFIIRYPEGRENETGMPFKPYHLRYVGVVAATEIFENNWILEDYLLVHGLLDRENQQEGEFKSTEEELKIEDEEALILEAEAWEHQIENNLDENVEEDELLLGEENDQNEAEAPSDLFEQEELEENLEPDNENEGIEELESNENEEDEIPIVVTFLRF